MKWSAMLRLASIVSVSYPQLLTSQNPTSDAADSAYRYLYRGNPISLRASTTLIAVIGDSPAVAKALAPVGFARDPLSDAAPLKQRKITVYRTSPRRAAPAQPTNLVGVARASVVRSGAVFQPVFEQGDALLIPSDEVIVGFAEGSDSAKVQTVLKPHIKRLGVRGVRPHRRDAYLVQIERPADARAFAVSRDLATLNGVTFAEPNFVVVMLDEVRAEGRGQTPPSELRDGLRKPRGPASRTGQRGSAPSTGPQQTHASVSWTVLINEGFEGAALPTGWTTGRWAADRADVYWNLTTLRKHQGNGGIHASSGGPGGVAPPGAYPANATSWLETPTLNLAGYEEVYVEVWFYAKLARLDVGLIYVREVASNTITSDLTADVVLGFGLDHTTDPTSDNGWRRALARVPPAARRDGSQVGFVFGSDAADGAEGLYIDQVRVLATTEVDTDPLGNDTYGARQYEFQNAGQIAGNGGYNNDLAVPEAWAIVSVSPQVIVAPVDCGVDLAHPDLSLVTGYDPDGSSGGGPRCPHGTAVAGNVGAVRNNGIGVMGSAPGVRLMPVYMGGDFAEIASAIDVTAARGARIVTNSWGWVGAPSGDIESAARDALEAGIVVLFAAGNGPDRPPFTYDTAFPCNLTASSDVICVGASSPSDEYKGSASSDGSTWWGSSYVGAGPDVTAPSPWSYTTDQQGAAGYNDGAQINPADAASADYTPVFGGTSSSTPKVGGVTALILSANLDLTPGQVKRILRETADDIDTPGVDDRTGAGRVNAQRAVARAFTEVGQSRAYHIQAVGHPTLARAGNKVKASVVVAVNSFRGPVTGLALGHFRARAGPVAAGGCEVEITRVVSFFPGRYLLDIVPFTGNPVCSWKAGRYVIAVLVTNGTYSGVGVTDLTITN